MSNCIETGSEQLCYIPCSFCNIVLVVSVPCRSLFDIVTVRCGHCTNTWSVNMAAAFQANSWQDVQGTNHAFLYNLGSSSECNPKIDKQVPTTVTTNETVVHHPPQRRQRIPSAYNQFIKEEIQRIKAKSPDISHREAFSTAAKNWAKFPPIQFGLMLEKNNAKVNDASS